jgi:hypothetical protein
LIYDIGQILTIRENIDWDLVLSIARKKRIERILFVGLRFTEELLDSALPGEVSEKIRQDPKTEHLVSDRIHQIFTDGPYPKGDLREVFYWIALRECMSDKLRVILNLIFIPNHDDWSFLSLPRILAPFYYIIRPFRLICEYAGIR